MKMYSVHILASGHTHFQNSKRKFLTQVLSPGNLSDTLEQYFPREVKEQRESFSPGGASYYVSKECFTLTL